MKLRQLGAESFHADGRTEQRRGMTKQKAVFHNFANAPKTRAFYHIAMSLSKTDILTEVFSTSANGQATKKPPSVLADRPFLEDNA